MQIGSRSSQPLRGRDDECETLLGLLRSARSGRSGVLVVHGDAGIGKTALLDYLVDQASDCRVLRAAGVETEMELAFAGLHQLCHPLLDGVDELPPPQAEALGTAFGMRSGSPPDRFLIGLGVLTLLSEHTGDRPLVCVIDDAQWLDQASLQGLTFVARRLAAESVVMVFAARPGDSEQAWMGLPRLAVAGLRQSDATAILLSVVATPMDERVRDRILAETRGNPLALMELPRWMSSTELTFGPQQGGLDTVTDRVEDGFRRQLEPLSEETRRLLLIAAAEPLGDIRLFSRAAEQLGLRTLAASPAETAGLIDVRGRIRFRHPLVRSAVYRSADHVDRQAAHRALAEVTDPYLDPDRRAWHRAHAADRPDESVAAELEQSADRALAHGGLAAGVAFLQQAARLTPAEPDRIERELMAAQAMVHAGAFDNALRLLAEHELHSMSELQRARAEVLRAQISFVSNRGQEALTLLLAAARRLEPLDLAQARDTYVTALEATLFVGHRIGDPLSVEVARAARNAPVPSQPRRSDLLLQCMASLQEDGLAAAAPLIEQVLREFQTADLSVEEGLRFLVLAGALATDLWDLTAWTALANRHLECARGSGALTSLQFGLNSVIFPRLFAGDLAGASAVLDEAGALAEIPGITIHAYGAIGLSAFRGDREQAEPLIAAAKADASARGEWLVVALTYWANALLGNGNGNYRAALAQSREFLGVIEEQGDVTLLPVGTQPGGWILAELVEAAVRCEERAIAAAAAEKLTEVAETCGTDWALGVAARSRAQLDHGDRAEELYREAIERLGRTEARVELARAQLLYGEWLRRSSRRVDAREVLRPAHESLLVMGVEAFAERARKELAVAGEAISKRTLEKRQELTAQELHIARLAAEGRTNAEIGAELYLSRHTIEWHLRKVFAKLDVKSRRQLRSSL